MNQKSPHYTIVAAPTRMLRFLESPVESEPRNITALPLVEVPLMLIVFIHIVKMSC